MTAVESGHWATALQRNVEEAHKEMDELQQKIADLMKSNDELYEELQVLKRMLNENGES